MINFERIRWMNFLSTGNYPTEMDLTGGVPTLIVGENGSGKSTFIDAMCFALFGKPHRKINKPNLINSINERGLLVEVEFSTAGKSYVVRRGMKPNIFEILEDGRLIDQESSAKDYQKLLEQNILKMNYKSFTQVVILGSSNFTPFMQLTAADRRAVIEDLLDIQIFSNMNVVLKSLVAQNREEIRENEYSLKLARQKVEMQKEYMENMNEKRQDQIDSNQKEIERHQKRVEELSGEISSLQEEIELLRSTVSNFDSLSRSVHQLREMQKKFSDKIKRIQKSIDFYVENSVCPTCTQSISEDFRDNIVSAKESHKEEVANGLNILESKLNEALSKLDSAQSVMDEISEKQSEITHRNASISAANQYISKLQSEIQRIESQPKHTENEKEKLRDLYNEVKGLNDARNNLLDDSYYLDLATTLLKDTGIKSKIIKQYLPIMNKLINRYLQKLDFFVEFYLDENFNESIKSRHRDEFSYHNFSEGEKMKIDLSILFAWREVARMKNSASTNLLILDEVFDSSLDTNGIENFFDLLDYESQKTKIFVISHKGDALRDKFGANIRFEKYKGFSRKVTG